MGAQRDEKPCGLRSLLWIAGTYRGWTWVSTYRDQVLGPTKALNPIRSMFFG